MTTHIIAIVLAIVIVGVLWLAPPLLHRAIQSHRVHATARGGHRRIAITYDDGPGPTLTPQLLDLLARHRAPATFFMLGRRAEASPDTASRVADAGHEVATHSGQHLHAWKVAPWRAVRDLASDRWAREIFRDTPTPTLLRPPYGKMTLATWLAALLRGRRIAWWTIDSGDTWPVLPTPHELARRVVEAGGGIVLLHDFDRENATADERHAFVLEATRAILEEGARAGFTFCTCSAMLAPPTPTVARTAPTRT